MLLLPITSPAQRYVEISGKVELTSYKFLDSSGAPKRRTYPFTCIVGTNEWRIENEFLSNAREAWYFDGTNVYHSIRQIRETSDTNFGGLLVYQPFEQVRSNITISIIPSQGGLPLGDLGVNVPWLAFCSATYLKLANRVIPLPTANVREDIGAFGYSDKAELINDELGLPKTIDLFTSQKLYKSSFEDTRVLRWKPEIQQAALNPVSGYSDGILKFHYEIEDATNFFGWTFPSKFKCTTYELNTTNIQQPRVGGIGTIMSIREGARPENVFMPELNQTIVDYRFRDEKRPVDGISYKLTNSSVAPPINDPVLRVKFDRVVQHSREELSSRRRWIWGAFLLILATPLLLAVRHNLKQKLKAAKLQKELNKT
jgi:hypothetical protein